MNNKNGNKENNHSLLNIIGGVLLFLCCLAMIICCVLFIYNQCITKPVVHRFYVSTVESGDSVLQVQSMAKIDSLMGMIVNHESELSEKYQYLIEKKDDENTFMSIGLMIVGVVISIAGFFGYSSMKSIKEESEHIAQNTAREESNEYLDKNIKNKICEIASEYYRSRDAEVMSEKITSKLLMRLNKVEKQITEELKSELKEYIDKKLRTSFTWDETSSTQDLSESKYENYTSSVDEDENAPSPESQFGKK